MEVRAACARERVVVAETLATAFAADPVVRWLLPAGDRDVRMFRALAAHVHAAPGCADLAWEDGELRGAALWDPPGHRVSYGRRLAGLATLFLAMGPGIRRGAVLEAAFARARPPGAFWYLAQLGASTPGRGAGSALLEHRLAKIEGPAYLESSNFANLPLYQRFGFEVVEEIRLPDDGPTLWTMLRS